MMTITEYMTYTQYMTMMANTAKPSNRRFPHLSHHELAVNMSLFDTEEKLKQGLRIMYYPTGFYTARTGKLKISDGYLILNADNYPFMIKGETDKWVHGPLTMFVNSDGTPTTEHSSIRRWRWMDEDEQGQSEWQLQERHLKDESRFRSFGWVRYILPKALF